MKMIALFKNKTMNIVMAAAILITCVLSGSITTYFMETISSEEGLYLIEGDPLLRRERR